jgi:galactokinase/mevalonate kinase-like predicted kinase
LAGGGTDLSPYCDEFGGAVLNTTIDRFAYAFISPRDDYRIVFRAKDLGREETLGAAPELPQAALLLHRGVYERMVRDYNGGRESRRQSPLRLTRRPARVWVRPRHSSLQGLPLYLAFSES